MSNSDTKSLSNINPRVVALAPYMAGKPAEEFAREYGTQNPVRLASNENPRGPGERVNAAVRAQIPELSRYPDPAGYRLRSALAGKLGVRRDEVTLGCGSGELLEIVARAILVPGAEAIMDQHCFMVYPLAVELAHGKVVRVPSRDWGHDLDSMLQHVTGETRLVFIANPNNPTGSWLLEPALCDFLDALPRNIWVVLDEAYFEYASPIDGFPDGVALRARYPNLIVTRTFSKIYGMASLRVGYAVSSPEFSELINRVRPPFNVSSVALAAAEAALSDDEFVLESRSLNASGKEVLRSGLVSMGCPVLPSAGNFITFDCGRSAAPVYEDLLRQGVIVRPISNYRLPDFLRVTIGTSGENDQFLEAMRRST